jgi:hypothetical protein
MTAVNVGRWLGAWPPQHRVYCTHLLTRPWPPPPQMKKYSPGGQAAPYKGMPYFLAWGGSCFLDFSPSSRDMAAVAQQAADSSLQVMVRHAPAAATGCQLACWHAKQYEQSTGAIGAALGLYTAWSVWLIGCRLQDRQQV